MGIRPAGGWAPAAGPTRRLAGAAAVAFLILPSTPARANPPSPGEVAPEAAVEVAPPATASALDSRCGLLRPGAERADASECLACHDVGRGAPAMQLSHPVGLDYAAAQRVNPSGLRLAEEVVRRGVLLPDGKVQCVTCHDAASPWASHVALPPGAIATPAVNPRVPATYLRAKNWRMASPADPPPPAGAAVTPSPLCATCHTIAD